MAELDAFASMTGYTLLGLDASIRTLELFGYYSHLKEWERRVAGL